LVVPREKIPSTLREIYRVAKPGARILIGEIPFEPGPPPEPEFATTRETLGYLYNQYGLRTALGMLRRWSFGDFAASHSRFGTAARSPSTRSPRK